MTEQEKQKLGLPWRIDGITMRDTNGRRIFTVSSKYTSDAEDEANSAYAVRAVNAHAALVAACEMAMKDVFQERIAKKICAALALARGEGK